MTAISAQAQAVYDQMHQSRELYPDLSKRNYPLATQQTSAFVRSFAHLDDVKIEKKFANGVRLEVISVPGAAPDKFLYYIHGGGFVLGEPAWGYYYAVETARQCGRNIIAVDYRLAPEHPFPAGPEDCIAGYQWMLQSGIAPQNIIFLGESSGGNLILSVAAACRLRNIPLPAALCPISPVVDLHFGFPSYKSRGSRECVLALNQAEEVQMTYIKGGNLSDPLASPYYADCGGFSPTFLVVSTEEMLFDDSVKMHEKLLRAGVDSRLKVWEGMWHTFCMMDLPESREVIQDLASFCGEIG